MLAARHPLTRILAHHLISVSTGRDGVHVGGITTPPAYGIHPFGCSGETVNSSALRVHGTQSWGEGVVRAILAALGWPGPLGPPLAQQQHLLRGVDNSFCF